jgi:hypothetical protein
VSRPSSAASWAQARRGYVRALRRGAPPSLPCPDFQTTIEFLDVHRAQAEHNRVLIARAEADGRQRLAANHRRVQESLDRIIGALENLGEADGDQR